MSKMIIITGCLAAGKTTFAKKLSAELNIPLFSKDLIKVALSEYITIANREESSRLSKATVSVMINIAESLMLVNKPFILEANFRQYEGERIGELLKKYNYSSLTYLFVGDPKILGKRFVERESTDERHNANKLFEKIDDLDLFDKWFEEYRNFNVGDKIITVDATYFEKVDFDLLINAALKITFSAP